MPANTKGSPKLAPDYALHREGVTAVVAIPTSHKNGINMASHSHAHVQVVPSGGADPTVEVLWWSAAAGVFVKEHVALTRAGIGANTPYEFTVESRGRIMFVAVTVIVGGTVDVHVAGYNVERV